MHTPISTERDTVTTMQAIVHEKYGPPEVLQLKDVEKPVVGDDDVLVRVHSAATNPLDWHYMTGTPYLLRLQGGLRTPKRSIAGVDMAGTVEAVGKNVTAFQPNDEVFGEKSGAFAEYVCGPERLFVHKPENVTFEQAAAVPVAGYTALQGLRDKGMIKPGHKVLVNGASGGVGTFGVQIAKALGAEVTGVCSAPNIEMVRSIGADHVLDYTTTNFTKEADRYDIILDCAATHSFSAVRRVLNPDGVYVMVGWPDKGNWISPLTKMLKLMLASAFRSQTMSPLLANANHDDLETLRQLIESGDVKPVIDRRYRLDEATAAMRRLGEGHASGKSVINL